MVPFDFNRHKGDAEPVSPTYGNSFKPVEIGKLQPYEGDFIIEEMSSMTLSILDLNGREISVLHQGELSSEPLHVRLLEEL